MKKTHLAAAIASAATMRVKQPGDPVQQKYKPGKRDGLQEIGLVRLPHHLIPAKEVGSLEQRNRRRLKILEAWLKTQPKGDNQE